MISTPWPLDAALIAATKGDRRAQEAVGQLGNEDCGVCGQRQLFSDCYSCGIDIPPNRSIWNLSRYSHIGHRYITKD